MSKTRLQGLSDVEMEFYSRQIMLPDIGYSGQLKLKNSKVCVVGLGGLGSPAAIQLAAMGIGFLRLVDRDIVELSNLQRQHLYSTKFVGYPKVEVAATRLKELNPNIEIEAMPLALTANNAEETISGVDVVIDGLDLMSPRYVLNRACVKLRIPYVFGAAITTCGSISTIVPGKTACLECFQGNLEDDALPKCALVGVHSSILTIIASIQVSEAVRILTGKEPNLSNRILHCDIGNMTFEELEISKADECPVCGSKPSKSLMPIKQKIVTEICGRGGKRVFVITPENTLDLNIEKLNQILKSKGVKVTVKADLGITFDSGFGEKASILKSGVMIIEGSSSEKEAYDFYKKLIPDRLPF